MSLTVSHCLSVSLSLSLSRAQVFCPPEVAPRPSTRLTLSCPPSSADHRRAPSPALARRARLPLNPQFPKHRGSPISCSLWYVSAITCSLRGQIIAGHLPLLSLDEHASRAPAGIPELPAAENARKVSVECHVDTLCCFLDTLFCFLDTLIYPRHTLLLRRYTLLLPRHTLLLSLDEHASCARAGVVELPAAENARKVWGYSRDDKLCCFQYTRCCFLDALFCFQDTIFCFLDTLCCFLDTLSCFLDTLSCFLDMAGRCRLLIRDGNPFTSEFNEGHLLVNLIRAFY